tara:strand:- start:463 stop:1068 length:606 start_codon:yes stop_codon:yes gene_type:complete
MTDLHNPVPLVADLVDIRTDAIVRRAETLGGFDEAGGAEIRVSLIEVAVNDCIHLVNGHINECCLRLGIERNQARPNARQRDPDEDVDKVVATTVRCCRDAARGALRKADRVRREPDPVLRDARTMLRQYCQALNASVGARETEPWLYLSNEFWTCAALLVTNRAKDIHRVTALFRWKAALEKTRTMMASNPLTFSARSGS